MTYEYNHLYELEQQEEHIRKLAFEKLLKDIEALTPEERQTVKDALLKLNQDNNDRGI